MEELEKKFEKAWSDFWNYYKEKQYSQKQFKFPGYVSNAEKSWLGPYFWSEQDIVLYLSRFCVKYFPEKKGWVVHNNAKVTKTFFVDVKKGERCYPEAGTKKKGDIERDCEKLQGLINKRCKHAYMCVIDDEPEKSQIESKLDEWRGGYRHVKIFYNGGTR